MSRKKILMSLVSIAVVFAMMLTLGACSTPASTGASADAGGNKPFKDIKVVFFCGGGEGDVFATTVYNGAKQAEADLGCQVEYIWSDWDPNQMVNQLKEAIARQPDGIAIMGHPGDEAYKTIVDEAESKGIIVTSQNTTLPELEAQYKTAGFGYVGQELYASGVMLASEAAKRAGLQSGDRAMVWGLASQPGRGERTKGCVDALEELGVTVDYIEISDAINADPSQGTPTITSYLASNPDCKMVITDHGSLTATLGTYLKAAGKQPGEVFGAGFDLSGDTSTAITEGWVGAVLDQQQWLQGYIPVLQICLTKAYQFAGLHIDTGAAIIDESNIESIKPLAEAGIR
jgi:simple sugar transport system substrate-binding protein